MRRRLTSLWSSLAGQQAKPAVPLLATQREARCSIAGHTSEACCYVAGPQAKPAVSLLATQAKPAVPLLATQAKPDVPLLATQAKPAGAKSAVLSTTSHHQHQYVLQLTPQQPVSQVPRGSRECGSCDIVAVAAPERRAQPETCYPPIPPPPLLNRCNSLTHSHCTHFRLTQCSCDTHTVLLFIPLPPSCRGRLAATPLPSRPSSSACTRLNTFSPRTSTGVRIRCFPFHVHACLIPAAPVLAAVPVSLLTSAHTRSSSDTLRRARFSTT